jgi:hypothetical protein
MNFVRLVFLIAAVCFAGAAEAQVVWSISAANCVPTDASIRADRYKTNVGPVTYNGTAVGAIVLNCPVSAFDTQMANNWQLGLNYRDSTGTAATALVRARLYAMSAIDAAPTATLLAQVHSNTAPNETAATVRTSNVFQHSFLFGPTSYWVMIDLDRDLASQIVSVSGVYLRFALLD